MKHIAITRQVIEGAEVNSVNARDLHKYLEVKKDFTDWIKTQLELDKRTQTMFQEDIDYIKNPLKVGKKIDYILSMETAKHIAMMSKVKKGIEVRKYFIDIEKQHNKSSIAELSDMQHNIKSLLVYTDKMGEVVTTHEKRLDNLELNRRMESWMEKNLLDAKNKKVYELANSDDALAKKLHSRVWRAFKNKFSIPRYSELTTGRYEDGLEWLNNVTLAEVV